MKTFKATSRLWGFLRTGSPLTGTYEKPPYSGPSTGELASDADISDTEPFLHPQLPLSRRHCRINTPIIVAIFAIINFTFIFILLAYGPSASILNTLLPQPTLFPSGNYLPSPINHFHFPFSIPHYPHLAPPPHPRD